MKLLVFGVGKYLKNRRETFSNDDEIIGYIDNNAKSICFFEDKIVLLPKEAIDIEYDYVLIMALDKFNMRDQLLMIGYEKKRIMFYEEYQAICRGNHKFEVVCHGDEDGKKNIVIVTDILRYNGGALAAINSAKALRKRDYAVTLVTSYVDEKIVKELSTEGISIAVGKMIPYITEEDFYFFSKFDIAIVNVFIMIQVACELSRFMPVLWWIHENSDRYNDYYKNTRIRFWKYDDADRFKKIRIAAVSQIAKRNFEEVYMREVDTVFPVGIVDESLEQYQEDDEIIFSIIGMIFRPKAQDVFIDAFNEVMAKCKRKISARIIGEVRDEHFYKCIIEKLGDNSKITFTGELNRKFITEQFKAVDVVVCASQEETLSLAIVEGMMHSKVVITTDGTGVADYIEDGVNGFVCKAGSSAALAEKMAYVIDNYEKFNKLRNSARKTYEEYFTLDALGERLEKEILSMG